MSMGRESLLWSHCGLVIVSFQTVLGVCWGFAGGIKVPRTSAPGERGRGRRGKANPGGDPRIATESWGIAAIYVHSRDPVPGSPQCLLLLPLLIQAFIKAVLACSGQDQNTLNICRL